MKKLKLYIYLNLLILLLSSCGSVKESFKNQKKNSSDEFLVEKKSPLVMPPNFKALPIPTDNIGEVDVKENSIKNLIIDNKKIDNSNDNNGNLEVTILGKIKSN